ncbi:HNH endonuclease [Aeromonas jandaei]|uniref:HNH endonuclease n=1 Tax=Aeromonas jandaei TaxID=650 RepID=UPI003B9F4F00
MFFPKLERRPKEDYLNRLKKFYADYRDNHQKISEDCKNRCVYCDILLSEMGHEGFQLDHFRPQAHFPSLATDPYNLVLACPKCNVLKSDDWPALKSIGNPSYINTLGYIDSFVDDPSDFFEVQSCGTVKGLKNPANYILLRLQINRASRKKIRRERIISKIKNEVNILITQLLTMLNDEMKNRTISYDSATERLEYILNIQKRFDSLK